jgi:threonine synthase
MSIRFHSQGGLVPGNCLTCPLCRKDYPIETGIFSCPGRRPEEEHILRRMLATDRRLPEKIRKSWAGGSPRTFELLYPLLSGFSLLGHERYGRILDGWTDRLLRQEGRDFEVTPLIAAASLASALGRPGRLWVKDETGNVTGSHKGRHLMATLLYLEALRELRGGGEKKVLAIYSCGNAALGAAAVARAGGYELHAFVPEDIDPAVAAMLCERDAVVEKIPRLSTGAGDPCYLAFRRAIAENGWMPFACAGNDNWSNIEGGATLGWELILQLLDRSEKLDSLVIQVGGGALARSVAQALEEALQLGLIDSLPRIHVCQPEGGFPFVRAYLLALAEIAIRSGHAFDPDYERTAQPESALHKLIAFARTHGDQVRQLAAFASGNFDSPVVQSVLETLAQESNRFMWPWDGAAPHSLAHGILDDVAYDWYHLLKAVLRSGGTAEILAEDTIRRAHEIAQRCTGIRVCPTGAAGLAGFIQLQTSGTIDPSEAVAVLFTGFDRTQSQ